MGGRHRGDTWLYLTYVLLAASAGLALSGPPPVLLAQGGRAVSIAWGVCCLLGAATGCYGTARRRIVIELMGLTFGASASLTWATALILQSVDTHSRAPLTSACLALTIVVLIGQRWVEAARRGRGGGKE